MISKAIKPINFLIFLLSFVLLFSCSKKQEEEVRKDESTIINLVYPPELFNYLQAVKNKFETERGRLGDGRLIKLQLRKEFGVSAAKAIANGEIKAEAWITSQALVNYTNANLQNLGAKQVNCTPIFSTPIVVAVQPQFVSAFQEQGRFFSWEGSFADSQLSKPNKSNESDFSYGMGAVDRTAAGLSGLLQLIYLANAGEQKPLTLARLRQKDFEERLQKYAGEISFYGSTDENLLGRIDTAQTSRLVFALTTEQQVINYNLKVNRNSPALVALYPNEGSVWQDYMLCTSEADWPTAPQRAGVSMFNSYMQAADAQSLALESGFRPASAAAAATQGPISEKNGVIWSAKANPGLSLSGEVIGDVFSNWQKYTKPSASLFVLDISGTTTGQVLTSGKSFVRSMLLHAKANDLSSVLSFADKPILVSNFSSDHASKMEAVDKLTAGGGSALYDTVAEAVKLMVDPQFKNYRKNIFIFTDGKDNSSSTTLSELIENPKETKRQYDIGFEILAVQIEGVDLSDLDKIAAALNGNVRKFYIADIDKVVGEYAGIH